MTASVYLAGPMRGIKDFNFDAFYDAEGDALRALTGFPHAPQAVIEAGIPIYEQPSEGEVYDTDCGITVFNPARRDHEKYGPDVNKSETGDLADLPDFDLREALAADLGWIANNATHIYLLDGWENSKGARVEKALAEALGLTVLYQSEPTVTEGDARDWEEFWEDTTGVDQDALPDYETPSLAATLAPYTVTSEVSTVESICQEADRIVAGERRSDYGHPFDNFTHTGALWATILGVDEVTPEQVGLCMIAVKLSRHTHAPKRDNLVDMAGYAKTLDLIASRREADRAKG